MKPSIHSLVSCLGRWRCPGFPASIDFCQRILVVRVQQDSSEHRACSSFAYRVRTVMWTLVKKAYPSYQRISYPRIISTTFTSYTRLSFQLRATRPACACQKLGVCLLPSDESHALAIGLPCRETYQTWKNPVALSGRLESSQAPSHYVSLRVPVFLPKPQRSRDFDARVLEYSLRQR
jgi:hypothetical protein